MNWRAAISDEMRGRNDLWSEVEAIAPPDLNLDAEFDAGYGSSEGAPFTVWTKSRVYFPVVYDGAEWVGSVPRNPNNEATEHHGGQ